MTELRVLFFGIMEDGDGLGAWFDQWIPNDDPKKFQATVVRIAQSNACDYYITNETRTR